MAEGRHIVRKSHKEIKTRCYEDVLNDIRKVAEQQEEIERERERQQRLNTPIYSVEDIHWKYAEYNLSINDKTLKITTPMEVNTFVKLKRDALQLGFDNIIMEV